MTDREFLKNVGKIGEMCAQNALQDWNLDFAVLNETLIEQEKRLRDLDQYEKDMGKQAEADFMNEQKSLVSQMEDVN